MLLGGLGRPDRMTPEDIQKGRNDPIFFIENFLGMSLHKGQKKLLRKSMQGVRELVEAHNTSPDSEETWELTRRFILSCANRWGKTAAISCLQLWFLFYKFGIKTKTQEEWFDIEYRTANIAPFSSLTEPVFIAMRQIMTSTYPIKDRLTGMMTTNKCKIEPFYREEKTINSTPYKLYFANNSYIEHLSLMGGKGDNLQGKPYGLITYDEAPRSDHLQIELDNSILGRLLDWTAPLFLVGTTDQNSKSLIYWSNIHKEGLIGVNSSYTQEGSIYENEFMTAEEVSDHEKMLEGNPLRDQMLLGKIIFGTQTIFPGQDIEDAQDEELNNGVRYQEGHKYIVCIDTAIGSDEMVYHVLDVTSKPYKKVWTEAVKGSARSPQMHLNVLCNLWDSYRNGDNIEGIMETFNGESARFYEDLPPYIKVKMQTFGSWQPNKLTTDNHNPIAKRTNQIKKADIIVALKKALAAHNIKIPKTDFRLIEQLLVYREDDKGLATDRVIALCLGVWLAENSANIQAPVWRSVEM
jgi:hypothetical protein